MELSFSRCTFTPIHFFFKTPGAPSCRNITSASLTSTQCQVDKYTHHRACCASSTPSSGFEKRAYDPTCASSGNILIELNTAYKEARVPCCRSHRADCVHTCGISRWSAKSNKKAPKDMNWKIHIGRVSTGGGRVSNLPLITRTARTAPGASRFHQGFGGSKPIDCG